jgi:acetyl esterase/lipase
MGIAEGRRKYGMRAVLRGLRSHDRKGPKLCGQFLGYPMLGDRNASVSSRRYLEGSGIVRVTSWRGKHFSRIKLGRSDVSIDVGSAEVLRDEAVAYASKFWACGVQTELHVWPGGFHAFEVLAPTASLSVPAKKVQMN